MFTVRYELNPYMIHVPCVLKGLGVLRTQTLYIGSLFCFVLFVFCGAAAQCGPWPLFLRFLYHTKRRITVGRTPLDEWSARRRDLYLTTRNAHNRRTSMPPVGFEPTISAGQRPQTYALAPRLLGSAYIGSAKRNQQINWLQNILLYWTLLITMTAWSEVWVCGRSLPGIVGSNPVGGMDVCLLWVLCVVRLSYLRRVNHLSRRVLPNLVCLCVIVKPG